MPDFKISEIVAHVIEADQYQPSHPAFSGFLNSVHGICARDRPAPCGRKQNRGAVLSVQTLQDHDLTTAAHRRSTDPRKLVAAVRGDLDWIVMRCLEKDRTRRYDTANGLAMDIERPKRHVLYDTAHLSIRSKQSPDGSSSEIGDVVEAQRRHEPGRQRIG